MPVVNAALSSGTIELRIIVERIAKTGRWSAWFHDEPAAALEGDEAMVVFDTLVAARRDRRDAVPRHDTRQYGTGRGCREIGQHRRQRNACERPKVGRERGEAGPRHEIMLRHRAPVADRDEDEARQQDRDRRAGDIEPQAEDQDRIENRGREPA